jgi:predicted RNA binding protein YcfA (HicA-like mRNA interferase family)
VAQLHPISTRELIKKLKKFGFDGPYAGGKHLFMIKDNLRLTIPNPHRQEIGIDLLSRILKQAGITKKEWIEKTW